MGEYNSSKMRIWEERLDQLYDGVAEYAEDWEACIDMVEALPRTPETIEYLELLVQRLKRMDRRFNRITFHNKETRYWEIANYSAKMYSYWKHKYPDDIIVTPYTIHIAADKLKVEEQEQLQKQL